MIRYLNTIAAFAFKKLNVPILKNYIKNSNNDTTMDLQTGEEKFMSSGKPLGFTLQDFWQFQFSNIYDLQEHIAEFLVAKALGLKEPHNRSGWTAWDIDYCGIRIEVKETGYYYSWQAKNKQKNEEGKQKKKRRSWDIHKTYIRDNQGNPIRFERQNDIYVFCLNTGENKEDSHPLKLEHWKFYIILTSVINERCKDNKSISLGVVEDIASEVPFSEIKNKIDELIQKMK